MAQNSATITVSPNSTDGTEKDRRVWRTLAGVQSDDHLHIMVRLSATDIRLYPETFIPNPEKLTKALEKQGISTELLANLPKEAAEKLQSMAMGLYKGDAALPKGIRDLPTSYIAFRHDHDWTPTIHIQDQAGMPSSEFVAWGATLGAILEKHTEVPNAKVSTVLNALGVITAKPIETTVNGQKSVLFQLTRIKDDTEKFAPIKNDLMAAYGLARMADSPSTEPVGDTAAEPAKS